MWQRRQCAVLAEHAFGGNHDAPTGNALEIAMWKLHHPATQHLRCRLQGGMGALVDIGGVDFTGERFGDGEIRRVSAREKNRSREMEKFRDAFLELVVEWMIAGGDARGRNA